MLIKIRTSNTVDSWKIIERVSELDFSDNLFAKTFNDYGNQISHALPADNIVVYGTVPSYPASPCFAPTKFAWIKYLDNKTDDYNLIIYNTIAYICGDDGKTVHKSVIEPVLINVDALEETTNIPE